MTWILLDEVVALLLVAAWFTAAVTLVLGRVRIALAALVTAVLLFLVRVVSVSMLAGRGWWFVQEKVLLGLPMLGVAAAGAVVLAGRPLLAASHGTSIGGRRGDGRPAGGAVWVFTAAYAALAGLAVTLVVGYPLTVGTALVTVSLVGAGAWLTARVLTRAAAADPGVAPAGAADPVVAPAVSRRRFLGWTGGAVLAATAGVGTTLSFLRPTAPTASSTRASVSVGQFRGPDSPASGGVVRRFELTARQQTVRLASGRSIDAWTFNGEVPGPAITATQGDLIEVRLRNADIADGVTLHWHGYDVPCGEDGAPGVTQLAVKPGEEFGYRFRADQAGTYWYHTHHASHVGVHKGLYGTLVVAPRVGAPADQLDLTLPVHTFDGTVLIGDDHTVAPGTPVRLRLVNTDSDPHRIVLAGTPFRVAAVDGRDLNQPGEVSDVGLRLPAGGRLDLVFVMPATAVALAVDGRAGPGLRPPGDASGDLPVGTGRPELDLLRYGVPAALPFDPRAADRHFTMVLDRGVALVDGRPAYAHTVNGRGHPAVPDQIVRTGDIVRFTVVNRSLATHPWHLHGHPVLILSRDGQPSTGSPLWMDTFDVRPGEVWEVAFHATNPGIWMNHCHNLPHAHQGMMLRLCYDGVTTPFDGSHPHDERGM